jgi:membrane-associated phospholipid phosphatase
VGTDFARRCAGLAAWPTWISAALVVHEVCVGGQFRMRPVALGGHVTARWAAVGDRGRRADRRLLCWVTDHPTELLDRWMPRLSRASDRLVLWWAIAGLMAIPGRRRLRSAARHGVVAMLWAGPVSNAVGKQVIARSRPPRSVRERRPGRVPGSDAFPSGHSAAAVAFATAVVLRAPAPGVAVSCLAGAVVYARLYTGAHYPSDVVAGAGVGAAAALLLAGLGRKR